MPTLKVDLANDPGEVIRLLDAVETFVAPLEPPPKALNHFLVSVEEIVRNAILHGGLEPSAPGPQVTVMLDDGELVCEVVDAGKPFDPFTEAPPPDLAAPIAGRAVGGLGVHLVRRLMDACSYRRRDGRNHTVLRKQLG
jgi:anti-sigma regulatory factor (Ser/Thr protein kinase)